MHVITQKRIWEAKTRWPRAAQALDTWYRLIKAVNPADFAALKSTFPATDSGPAQTDGSSVCTGRSTSIVMVHRRKRKVYLPLAAMHWVGPFHVFDVGGNKLRLIAILDYRHGKVFIRHILDHAEYAAGRWRA